MEPAEFSVPALQAGFSLIGSSCLPTVVPGFRKNIQIVRMYHPGPGIIIIWIQTGIFFPSFCYKFLFARCISNPNQLRQGLREVTKMLFTFPDLFLCQFLTGDISRR